MLNGIDVSSWNSLAELKEYMKDADFVMMKATEGATFKDFMADTFVDVCANSGKPMFFYHFLRLDNNHYREEAEHFINQVTYLLTKARFLDKVGLVLDYEVYDGMEEEIGKMLKYMTDVHNVHPIVYMSESRIPKVGKYVDTDAYGLWVAKYSKVNPTIDPWKVMAFWQYTNSPIDRSRFYGDLEQLKKYQDFSIANDMCRNCPYNK